MVMMMMGVLDDDAMFCDIAVDLLASWNRLFRCG